MSNETVSDVCYCSTKEHPPIPEPISSEDKAKQLEQELAINPTNTSAALRKLTSAEDNRPSAVGVGYLGVGLLTAVFGGLFLLDLNVILAGIKDLFCTSADVQNSVAVEETDC
ncbi:uncharacterized protein LOC123547671 [Mercenaria mercenaria]|uniref:uncharacterized protein LOC123547671 n=1 Tax=Mercenaria mercenaria TaxID=6596 RepID=UPI00234E81BD|nr:uncharacterized protein LOC123547671 [Mercenaria mercenaria]